MYHFLNEFERKFYMTAPNTVVQKNPGLQKFVKSFDEMAKCSLISEIFSKLKKSANHHLELFKPKEKKFKIVIWHIFWRMEPN